jgi:hypothetical protein
MIKQACQCDGPALFHRLGFRWEPNPRGEHAGCFDSVLLSRGVGDSPELEGWLLVPRFGQFCPACSTALHLLVDKVRPLFDALPPAAPPSAVSWDDQEGTTFGLGPSLEHGGVDEYTTAQARAALRAVASGKVLP